eukprot:TRINITY_DN54505_c0_g1_i1.p1 TRINITY_DN54505_c0_g1~~TRINITY_DN54505_c0_g1_i1.p1  ORF type:complete len:694 (+),score=138.16 TRINITY_DN54505_c0_g1_i1:64-2145(+)
MAAEDEEERRGLLNSGAAPSRRHRDGTDDDEEGGAPETQEARGAAGDARGLRSPRGSALAIGGGLLVAVLLLAVAGVFLPESTSASGSMAPPAARTREGAAAPLPSEPERKVVLPAAVQTPAPATASPTAEATLPPAPPPAPPPVPLPPEPPKIHQTQPFSMALACAGKSGRKIPFKKRLQFCGASLVGKEFEGIGNALYMKKPNYNAEQYSYTVARPLYSVPMAKAMSDLAQGSQCGPQEFMRNWTCPRCKQEVGFELNPETNRFVRWEEQGVPNTTFVFVGRIKGAIHHPVARREKQPVQHKGEDCYWACGEQLGFCGWCGVGNACCGSNVSTDPLECRGTNTGLSYATCVEANPDRIPGPVVKDDDCYHKCGQSVGLCDVCGSGNACCKQGVGGARECVGATGFTGKSEFECVAPAKELGIPPPTKDEVTCMVMVRGSMNHPNTHMDLDYELVHFPWSECKGCKVHKGFHTVWRAVHMRVVRTLASIGCIPGTSTGSVLIAGLSFGAGVGTFAQYYLQGAGFTTERQYNFGSPRVGNVAWADNFNAFFDREVPIFRLTHAKDFVSRVPVTTFMPFKHVNSEVFYPGEDPEQYVVCLGGEDYECQGRWDLGQCMHHEIEIVDMDAPGMKNDAEAFDIDHCYSGLATDGDMCQCVLSPWWAWYKGAGLLKHRFDSAPDNTIYPRLAKGAIIG